MSLFLYLDAVGSCEGNTFLRKPAKSLVSRCIVRHFVFWAAVVLRWEFREIPWLHWEERREEKPQGRDKTSRVQKGVDGVSFKSISLSFASELCPIFLTTVTVLWHHVFLTERQMFFSSVLTSRFHLRYLKFKSRWFYSINVFAVYGQNLFSNAIFLLKRNCHQIKQMSNIMLNGCYYRRER